MIEVGLCFKRGTDTLRHFFAVDCQEAVNVHFGWEAVSSGFQHARPKQRVEVSDVFNDEMVDSIEARTKTLKYNKEHT